MPLIEVMKIDRLMFLPLEMLASLSSQSVYSLFCPAAFSSSPSSSSVNFPNCFYPRVLALVYANYLRSHVSVSQSKIFRSRARDHLSELRRATCSKEYYSFFYTAFSLHLLRQLQTAPRSLPPVQIKSTASS